MENPTAHQPLTDQEFDRLEKFFDSIGTPAMNLETLDGFFTALICGQDILRPSEYLPNLWGGGVSLQSEAQATGINELLIRHWNTISSELQRTLHEPRLHLPILLDREDGVAPASNWAHGFMRAVQMRPDSWRQLINDEDQGAPIVAIMMLHYEDDPDPEMRPAPITLEKRGEVLKTMIAGLPRIYRYFHPRRRAFESLGASTSMHRTEPKVGRNESCACGSGRKFKHCCLGKPLTLH